MWVGKNGKKITERGRFRRIDCNTQVHEKCVYYPRLLFKRTFRFGI